MNFGGPAPRSTGPLWRKLEAAVDAAREEQPLLPTAMQVAAAIVAAAKAHNEDPIRCAEGKYHGCDGRYTALWALSDLFPKAPREKLAAFVGAKSPDSFKRKALRGRGELYFWDEKTIDAVKASVLARSA